jgi:hypothetical protein
MYNSILMVKMNGKRKKAKTVHVLDIILHDSLSQLYYFLLRVTLLRYIGLQQSMSLYKLTTEWIATGEINMLQTTKVDLGSSQKQNLL